MVLNVKGNFRVKRVKVEVRLAAPFLLLFPEDRLLTQEKAEVVLWLKQGARNERVREKQEVTVRLSGCHPQEAVERLPLTQPRRAREAPDKLPPGPGTTAGKFISKKPETPPPHASPLLGTK